MFDPYGLVSICKYIENLQNITKPLDKYVWVYEDHIFTPYIRIYTIYIYTIYFIKIFYFQIIFSLLQVTLCDYFAVFNK